MKIEKLSLKNIKNVLSRAELKKIMAGSGSGCGTGGAICCQCTGNWGFPTQIALDPSGGNCPTFCEGLSYTNYSGYSISCNSCS